MKFLIIFSFLMLSVSICAQQKIHSITPEQLAAEIQSSPKPSIVQFWVPNCENNIEIVEGYKKLIHDYGTAIEFYFIGITNKEDLVRDLMVRTEFDFNLYIIDKNISPENLYLRKETFNRTFTELISASKNDFVTGYFRAKNNSFILTNSIKIRKSKIRKLMTN